jgi:transposase-like protein
MSVKNKYVKHAHISKAKPRQIILLFSEVEIDDSYFGYKKHFRVYRKNEFARGHSYINGIESFWGYARTRLVKFKGMDKKMFNLHLKKCEFRFNNCK